MSPEDAILLISAEPCHSKETHAPLFKMGALAYSSVVAARLFPFVVLLALVLISSTANGPHVAYFFTKPSMVLPKILAIPSGLTRASQYPAAPIPHGMQPKQSATFRAGRESLENEADDVFQASTTLQPEVQTYLIANMGVLVAGGFMAFSTSSVLMDIIAGAVASICVMLVGYPLDTAKTRQQIGQKVLNEDGFFGLYKGLSVGLLREASTAAIYLATCGFLKQTLVPANAAATWETLLLFLAIGAIATLASCCTRVPLEIVSKQIQSGQCQSLRAAARKVFYAPDGCSSVERAWTAVLLREVPYGAFQIAFFEIAKLSLTFLVDLKVPLVFQRMAWGALAGSGAAFLTTPFDVITSRVMVSPPEPVKEEAAEKEGEEETEAVGRPTVWQTVKKMYTEEGPGVFYTGSLLRAAFYSPGTCLFFSIFESVAGVLKQVGTS